MRKKSFLLGWVALLFPLITLWAKQPSVSSIWYTWNISNESVIEIKWTDLENCTILKVAGKNIEIKNKSAQSLSYNFSDSKEYSGSIHLECEEKTVVFYYSFPYIKNITFQTSKWFERFITISWKGFWDEPKILVNGGNFLAKVRSDDVISWELPENLSDEKISIEYKGLKSNIFDLWIKIPKINFAFSESGFTKRNTVTLFWENLVSNQNSFILIGTGETSGTKNSDGSLSFVLPDETGNKKIYVVTQWIKSNSIDINITWERPEILEVWEREKDSSGKKQLYIRVKNYSDTFSENKVELNGKNISLSSVEWNLFIINDYTLKPNENIITFIVSNKWSKTYSYQAPHISIPSIWSVNVGGITNDGNREFTLFLNNFIPSSDSIYLWNSKISPKECTLNNCKIITPASNLKWYFTVWRWDIINQNKIYFDKIFENIPYISEAKISGWLKSGGRITITGGNFEWASINASNFFATEWGKLDFSQGSSTISWLFPLDFKPESKSTITITKYWQTATLEFIGNDNWNASSIKWAPTLQTIQAFDQNEVIKPGAKIEVLWRWFDYFDTVEIDGINTELVFSPQQNPYFIMPKITTYGAKSLTIKNKDGQRSNKIDFILSPENEKKEIRFEYKSSTGSNFITDDSDVSKSALYKFWIFNFIEDMNIKHIEFDITPYNSSENLGTFQLNIWWEKYGPSSTTKEWKIIFKDIFMPKSATEITAEIIKISPFINEGNYSIKLNEENTMIVKLSGESFSWKNFKNFTNNSIKISINQKNKCIDSLSSKANCNTYLDTSSVSLPVSQEVIETKSPVSESTTETSTKKDFSINTLNFKTSSMIGLNKKLNTLAQKLAHLDKNIWKEDDIRKTMNLLLVGLYQYENSKPWDAKRKLALKTISREIGNLKKFLK